jgi:hypothetical protein
MELSFLSVPMEFQQMHARFVILPEVDDTYRTV